MRFLLGRLLSGELTGALPMAVGVEVLAAGPDEIGRLVRDSSPEERLKLKIGQP